MTLLESRAVPVIMPSGSCAAMIRHGYPELFAGEAKLLARARRLSERVFERTAAPAASTDERLDGKARLPALRSPTLPPTEGSPGYEV